MPILKNPTSTGTISPITLWTLNFLDHFDMQLCITLSPIWAEIFFSEKPNLLAQSISLHKLYWLTSAVAYPLGVLFFGWLATIWSPIRALKWSVLGFSISTLGMSCLPTAYTFPFWAPWLFACCRFFQECFARGERSLIPLYLLSYGTKKSHIDRAAAFEFSTCLGIYSASMMGTFVLKKNVILSTTWDSSLWRLPFLGAGLLGCLLTWWRWKQACTEPSQILELPQNQALPNACRPGWIHYIALACITGPWYVFYSLVFKLDLFYASIKLFSNIELAQQTQSFFGLDLLAVIGIRFLTPSNKETPDLHFKHMGYVCFFGLLALPILFYAISIWPFLAYLGLLRMILLWMGVYYTFHFFLCLRDFIQQPGSSYLSLSTAKMIGTIVLGRSAVYIILQLYALTEWVCAPGIYGSLVCALSLWGLYWFKQNQLLESREPEISTHIPS